MNCWSLLICSEVTQPLRCRGPHLDWGTVLSTNKKMAFSEGSWMRFLMIHMNWATVMSEGTRYFLLSMSTICDPDTFSTITWQDTQRDNDYSRHATKQISCKPAAMPLRRHSPGPCQGTCCGFWRTLCIDVLVDRKNNSHVNHVLFPRVSTEKDVSEVRLPLLYRHETRSGDGRDRYLNCEINSCCGLNHTDADWTTKPVNPVS